MNSPWREYLVLRGALGGGRFWVLDWIRPRQICIENGCQWDLTSTTHSKPRPPPASFPEGKSLIWWGVAQLQAGQDEEVALGDRHPRQVVVLPPAARHGVLQLVVRQAVPRLVGRPEKLRRQHPAGPAPLDCLRRPSAAPMAAGSARRGEVAWSDEESDWRDIGQYLSLPRMLE